MNSVVHVYPFLAEIPEAILSVIDLDALHRPTQSEEELVAALCQDLKKNIVVYKKNYQCKGTHLCRILRPAFLSPEQLDALNSIEKLFADAQVIVAYEKPLTFAHDTIQNVAQFNRIEGRKHQEGS